MRRLILFTMHSCPKCPAAREIARQLAEDTGLELAEMDMSTPDGQIEALMYNICSAPALVLADGDGEPLWIVRGLPTDEDIMRIRRLGRRRR